MGKQESGWLAQDDSDDSVYVRAFYFVVMTITSVGYGQEATTDLEILSVMVIEFIGVFFFPLLSAQVVSLTLEITQRLSDFTQEKVTEKLLTCRSRTSTAGSCVSQRLPRHCSSHLS